MTQVRTRPGMHGSRGSFEQLQHHESQVQISENWLDMDSEPMQPTSLPIPRNEGAYVEGTVKLVNLMECPRDVMCIKYHKDGSIVAVGLSDGSIKIICPVTCELLYNLCDDEVRRQRLPVTSIQFLPQQEGLAKKPEHQHVLLATYASGHVRLWNYRSNIATTYPKEDGSGACIFASAVNPEGRRFLTAGGSGKIYLYDIEKKARIRTFEPSDSRDVMNGHRYPVYAVQYHPSNPREFISGGWDDMIMFWDDRDKHAIRSKTCAGPHICGNDALDIDPVHDHIITGSWRMDNALQIWDYKTGEKIKDVIYDSLNKSQLYCAKWLDRNYMVCGGCSENNARIIDRGTLNTVGQLVELEQGVVCLDTTKAIGTSPRVIVGAGCFIYQLQLAKSF